MTAPGCSRSRPRTDRALVAAALVAALAAACGDPADRGEGQEAARSARATVTAVTAPELLRQIQAGTAPPVLDVRTPAEFAAGHVPGAHNIPHDQVLARIEEVLALKAAAAQGGAGPGTVGHLVVYCRTGRRTRIALPVLQRAGFDPIYYLEGQWTEWQARGLPVETGGGAGTG